jgi:hypothetical protein
MGTASGGCPSTSSKRGVYSSTTTASDKQHWAESAAKGAAALASAVMELTGGQELVNSGSVVLVA